MKHRDILSLTGLLMAPVFFLALTRPSALALQNPAAQAAQAEEARRRAQALDAQRRADRVSRHQFREVNQVAFPKTYSPVWYKPEKMGSSVTGSLMHKEYQTSGELTLEKDAITFKAHKEKLRIDYAQIESIEYRLLSTQRHASPYPIDWAIITFRMPDGSMHVAMFHDGGHSGTGEDTDLIFGSIRWAYNSARREQESKLAPVERLTRQTERLEAGPGRASMTEQEFKEALEQTSKETRAVLDAHPDDVDAMILLVRLALLQDSHGAMIVGKNAEEELAQAAKKKRARVDELAAQLDRALTLQPNRADAYYWKGRLYGLRQPAIRNGRFARVAIDLQEATRNARRATELAPDNVKYRVALALYLVLDGKFDDAAEAMRPVASGQHIISLLLSDRKALPVPEKAVFDATGAAGFAEIEMQKGRILDLPELRVLEYVINAPASEVTAFYRKRWPGFQFFETEAEKNEDMEMRLWGQVLIGPSNALQPLASKRDFEKEQQGYESNIGLLLTLTEVRQKSSKKRTDFDGVPVGDIFCVLHVLDTRTGPK